MWSFLAETARRIAYLLNRRKLDAELAEEMVAHAEMRGSAIGNTLRLREESRDVWGWLWLDRVQQDARYAFRTLRKGPGFVATSVFTPRVRVRNVSANYFTEVGYNALAGRLFVESVDGRADASPVAIVSEKFWQKRFANTPDLIGQTVRINDRPALVIGVTPEPF